MSTEQIDAELTLLMKQIAAELGAILSGLNRCGDARKQARAAAVRLARLHRAVQADIDRNSTESDADKRISSVEEPSDERHE
jgi:hypothetical protein